ncbi:hypothetical protein BV917_11840 [Leptospira santarosai serovar Guaricura]|nr:hypothetical protein BV917_11840 [Leptospira santarosai serovar Guaricura]
MLNLLVLGQVLNFDAQSSCFGTSSKIFYFLNIQSLFYRSECRLRLTDNCRIGCRKFLFQTEIRHKVIFPELNLHSSAREISSYPSITLLKL